MRAVVQRVSSAECIVGGERIEAINRGMVVLLGIGKGEKMEDAEWMSRKIVNLRIFEDTEGKMNLSLLRVGGEVLLLPQFTLYGDCRKGYRPTFSRAAPPDKAERMFREVGNLLEKYSVRVAKGIFGAKMRIRLENDGPVTLIISSKEKFREIIHE